MPRECAICAEADSEETPLLELPCFEHWVCREVCIADYFEKATSNESLYPPQCCGQLITLDRFVNHVPEDVQMSFKAKEQGEYTIMPKYRVYCANSACGKFLHPSGHIKDSESSITYAVCDSDDCFQATCCSCKTLLIDGIQGHVCKINDDDQKFKETVDEKGYKECHVCGATVELVEACNHITCGCGNSFCYICGKEWIGVHGCPQYGPAQYVEEDYNQYGYHRDTGLNRDGRNYLQQTIHDRGGDDGEEDEEDEDEEDDEGDGDNGPAGRIWNQILSGLHPERRAILESLDIEQQEDILTQVQIALIDRGTVLNIHPPQLHGGGGNEGDGEQELEGADEGEGDLEGEEDPQEDGNTEQLNAGNLLGLILGMGDGELLPVLGQDAHMAWIAGQGVHAHGANAAEEAAHMPGSWLDSDAPSPDDDLSPDTASNASSSTTSPDDLADFSDQEEI